MVSMESPHKRLLAAPFSCDVPSLFGSCEDIELLDEDRLTKPAKMSKLHAKYSTATTEKESGFYVIEQADFDPRRNFFKNVRHQQVVDRP
jgi:hypothetical protein